MKSTHTHIQIELIKYLYSKAKYAIWGEVLVAIGLAIVMWGSVNRFLLLCWLLFILIFSDLLRLLLVNQYRRRTLNGKFIYNKTELWINLYLIGVIFSGVSWGIAGSIFLITPDLLNQVFIIILLVGVTAAATKFYSAIPKVYITFLILVFVPLTFFLIHKGGVFIILGQLSIIYIIIMIAISFHINKKLYNSLKLRNKNSALLSLLSSAIKKLTDKRNELKQLLSLLRGTLEATTDGILVVDLENKIETYNKQFLSMWNISDEMIHGNKTDLPLIDFVSNQLSNPDEFVNGIKNLYSNRNAHSTDILYFKDGRIYERYSHPRRIGKITTGRVWIFRDVTARSYFEEKLLRQANYDALTGLPNRVLLLDRIHQAINHAKRQDKQIAILFVDLDRFKYINDTLGHASGDKLLKLVSERLLKCIRENDTISREGGDEFVIVLNDLDSEEGAISVAKKCQIAMNVPFVIDETKLNISSSIGICMYPEGGSDPETLIGNADIAMYRAKEAGKNNYQFFTVELNKKLQHRLDIENQLREALTKNEFFILYQPIINLVNSKVIAVEALLRWRHEEFGILQPSNFISIAEKIGVINSIGEWVLNTSCKQIKKWQNSGFPSLNLAVNLSTSQFNQENLHDQILQSISNANLDPGHLFLEITESSIMTDINRSIVVIKQLKESGANIVIDDFGTGYSSLNYLKRFTVDRIKIDRSFIHGIPEHHDDIAITSAIIALGHQFNIKIIAEGIENKEQLEYLLENKCDEVQGFYFSVPLEAKECKEFLVSCSKKGNNTSRWL